MGNSLLLGLGRFMLPVPPILWRRMVKRNARTIEASLRFMSPEHHRVRDFVVTELPRRGAPIAPHLIAEALGVPLARVQVVLAELEEHLTFLFRGDGDAVTWAYPVTVDTTPHRALFRTGEEAYSP